MQDLSLHILDIIENSVRALSRNVWVFIQKNEKMNELIFIIQDDGLGMDEETLIKAQNPFYTSKVERKKKVGLGIPLFKQNAELCNGYFELKSKLNLGTELTAKFQLDHIDRIPLGNLTDTLLGSIIGHPEVDFFLFFERISKDGLFDVFKFSTREIKDELGDSVPLTYPDVILFIKETLKNGIIKIKMEEY